MEGVEVEFERFGSTSGTADIAEGIYNACITEINDVKDRLRTPVDGCYEIKFDVEGVPFEVKTSIFIDFDRLPNGELDPDKNSWQWQFNNLLQTLNYNGGFDRVGKFRNENGEYEDDVAFELCKAVQAMPENKTSRYPYVINLQRSKKGFMEAGRRIFLQKDRAKLEAFVSKPKKQTASTTPQSGVRL